MTEKFYAMLSFVLLLTIVFVPSAKIKKLTPMWAGTLNDKTAVLIVFLAVTIPRLIFMPIIFEQRPIDEYTQALRAHPIEVMWHGNFETTLTMLIQYLSSFFSFGGYAYHAVFTILVSVLSSIVGVYVLKQLRFPTAYVVLAPIFLSWMRMYPEFVWLDHHDVYVILFTLTFLWTFLKFLEQPDKAGTLRLGVCAVMLMWINPTNFLIMPALFLLLIVFTRLFGTRNYLRPLAILFATLILSATGQSLKTYLSTGVFAPTGLGAQLISLNLYRHFQNKDPSALQSLFDRADVPYWYRRCYELTPPGRVPDMYWHGSLGECFLYYDVKTSSCRGPNYEFTRDHVIDKNDTEMQAIISRDLERTCREPYLFTVGFPEVGTEFGVEYQKVNAKLGRTWFLTDPIDVLRRAFLENYPLYELKGSPLLTSNYFAPLLEKNRDFGPFRGLFYLLANTVKIVNLLMVFTFHLLMGISVAILCIPRWRRNFLKEISQMSFAEVATISMLLGMKLMGMVIYCVLAGGEGERYWQYFSWQMACVDIYFLIWLRRRIQLVMQAAG